MYIKKLIAEKSGFTLIELMLALSILGIILAMGYSFFFFGSNSFRLGGDQSNLQRDMRLTSDFITREVRYAVDIEIVTTAPPFGGDGYHYIYHDLSDSIIKYVDPAGSVNIKTDPVIDKVIFQFNTVAIEVSDTKENYLLHFTIVGSSETNANNYQIDSEVMLNNISTKPADGSGSIIRYKKP